MKRVISAIAILVTVLVLFAAPAYAATIEVTTDPAVVTAPGYITIVFNVKNDSNFVMQELKIRGFGISDTNDGLAGKTIEPGKALKFSLQTVAVREENLGSAVVYTLYWTETGQPRSQEGMVMLGTGGGAVVTPTPAPAAGMTAKREASKTAGKEGDKVTLTYTLKNPGATPMTDITIKDSIAGSAAIKSGISLEGGGSTTATYEHTLTAEGGVSEPVITYTVNGESKTLTLEKLTLAAVNVKLTTNIGMGQPTAEGVLFNIHLKNDGNQTISGIVVKDDLGVAVNADGITLQAGQENSLSHMVKAEATRVVSFTITGQDATGQPYEDKTGGYEVYPYIDPSSVSIQLNSTIVENLNENGRMKISFTIRNNSTVELKEAVITEANLGEVVPMMTTLPQGETTKEVELHVGAPRELAFTLTVKDVSGAEHTHISTITAAPAATPPPAPTPAPTEEILQEEPAVMSNTLVTVLIVLAVLMAVAGIALLVLSIYERKRNAEMEALDADGYSRAPRALEGAEPVKASGRHTGKNSSPMPMEDEAPPYESKKKKTVKQARGRQPAFDDAAQPRLRVREDVDMPRNAATSPIQPEPGYRVTSERVREEEQIRQSAYREDNTPMRGQAQTTHVIRQDVQRADPAPAATPASPVHSYVAVGRERQPSGRLEEPPVFVRQPLSRMPRGASPVGEASGYRRMEGEEMPLPIQPTPVFKPEPLQVETPEPSGARHDSPEEEAYTNRYTPPGFVTPEYQQRMQEEQEAALQETPFRRIEEPPVRQGPPTQYAPPSQAQTIRPKRVQQVVPAAEKEKDEEKIAAEVNEPKPQASPIVRSRVHRVGPNDGRSKN